MNTATRPTYSTVGNHVQGERNRAVSFWQSRHPRHERIALADLRALARAIRSKPQ